jgi:aminopeptidase N
VNVRTIRWIVFSILVCFAAAVSIGSRLQSDRMLRELSSNSVLLRTAAYAELSSRSDAASLFQSLPTQVRARIASRLGEWRDSKMVGLALQLYSDPDSEVRSAIIRSIALFCVTNPKAVAREMAGADAARGAALTAAALEHPEAAVQVAESAFANPASRDLAATLLANLGARGLQVIEDACRSKDRETRTAAVEAASRMNADVPPFVQQTALELYNSSTDKMTQDAILEAMAAYPAPGFAPLFRAALEDESSPSALRIACARALIALQDGRIMAELAQDYDPDVRDLTSEMRLKTVPN